MRTTIAPALLGLILTGGCAVGPRYAKPQPVLAPAFAEVPSHPSAAGEPRIATDAAALAHWWTVFNDAELDALIDRAVHGNLDLQQALSRVREARAQRTSIAAGLWPQIEATAGYNRGHGSKNVELPFGQPSSGGKASSPASTMTRHAEMAPASDPPEPSGPSTGGGGAGAGAASSPFGLGGLPGITTNLYQAGFDASWEIDIFGGARRAIEAVNAGVEAAEEAQRGALVSLLAEVATTYVQLRDVQQRLQIARGNLEAQRDALGIVEAKFRTGFATDLDFAQQRAQVSSTEAVIPALESAERDAEHALAFLVGEPPTALVAELSAPQALPLLPDEIPVGVPSDLLRRRPDIRRAERQLAQAAAQVGVATADLLPKFSLTAAFGFDSSNLKNLGDWDSHYYSIAPGIRWPILDWGRIRANVRIESERQQQAFLSYRNTVSQALKDVEDALVHYEKEQTRRHSLAAAADASRRARELAQQRYAHGVTDLLTVLETQRTLLQAEDALAQSDGALRRDLIALYKALGGGWE